MAATTWTATRRLYLNKDGQVVEADDPTRQTLLVAAGNTLPLERARALGLVDEEGEPTALAATTEEGDEPAQKSRKAPSNKARTAPTNKAEPGPDETKE